MAIGQNRWKNAVIKACKDINLGIDNSDPEKTLYQLIETKRLALQAQNEKMREAVSEVIRISDRKHDAWDKVKLLLATQATNDELEAYVMSRLSLAGKITYQKHYEYDRDTDTNAFYAGNVSIEWDKVKTDDTLYTLKAKGE
jgi:hypothetical protein